jgi:glucan phosphoethanolaminetransferase (alkaline phosphatase superfamily)
MSGVLGLIALLLLLFVPVTVFLLRLRGSQGDAYAAAATGVAFVAAFMVFGLTQGPLSYKVIASFYGLVVVALSVGCARQKSL